MSGGRRHSSGEKPSKTPEDHDRIVYAERDANTIERLTGSVGALGGNRHKIEQYIYLGGVPPRKSAEDGAGSSCLDEEALNAYLSEYLAIVAGCVETKIRLFGGVRLSGNSTPRVRTMDEVFVPITCRRFPMLDKEERECIEADGHEGRAAQRLAYLRAMDERKTQGDVVGIHEIFTLGKPTAVVGSAGSGKTTLLWYIAAELAAAILEKKPAGFDLPDGSELPIPIVVPLRFYRQWEQKTEKTGGRPYRGLPGFISDHLRDWTSARSLPGEFFHRILSNGSCVLMLDGLDEVISDKERSIVKGQIERLVSTDYPGNYFIVTAREAGYARDAVFGDDFERLDIQALSFEQIERLVGDWCSRIPELDEKEAAAASICSRIKKINISMAEQKQAPLIDSPLMVNLVVSVYADRGKLPNERAGLYEACVDVILKGRHRVRAQNELHVDESTVPEFWGGDPDQKRERLSKIAFEMHRRGDAGAAIEEVRLKRILADMGVQDKEAQDFILSARNVGGLLEEKAELFTFVHLTFQEFMAARYVVKESSEGFLDCSESNDTACAKPGSSCFCYRCLSSEIGDSWWREVFLLIHGLAERHNKYREVASGYQGWLRSLNGVTPDVQLAARELAGAALLDQYSSDGVQKKETAELILAMLRKESVPISVPVRQRSGSTLGRLGDPRFARDARDNNWIEMPKCTLTMGAQKTDEDGQNYDADAYDDELPVCDVPLAGYLIGKYPVTVLEYGEFVADRGYEREELWTGNGCGRWNEPGDWEKQQAFPNRPVVGVSWYEATAYARWATGLLPEAVKKKGYVHCRLPTEAEWERAARGGKGQKYPWGDADPEPSLLNFDDSGIGHPTPVGIYPNGASAEGCLDMAGNVWEWCSSLYEPYPYEERDGRERMSGSDEDIRVLRGGSFYGSRDSVRCACRYYDFPDFRLTDYGFRVVSSPFSPLL